MVSPQPRRSSPAGQLVPSIEVVSPWAGALREDGAVVGVWNPGDQTPLLNNSSPSSDAGQHQAGAFSIFICFHLDGECHVSNITVETDTTEADNVTSISIDHDSSLYGPQEHDNKVKICCLSGELTLDQ